jgi:hypothetical protein
MSLTLLEIIQQAVGEISSDISTPTAITSSSDQTVVQLFRLTNRVGMDLVREFEWRRLVTEYTFATVNGTADYDLPSDYDRMVPDTHYDRTNDWKNSGPKSSQAWQWLNAGVTTLGPQFRWRLYQNKIRLYTTPTAAYTMAYEYVSNLWVLATGGTVPTKSKFSADTDTCIFPDDVMTLGLVYRWYRAKGLDYAQAFDDFRTAVSTAKGQDIPAGKQSLSNESAPMLVGEHNVAEANWSL